LRKIAIVNQKGGVGKTTTAVNLGAALARLGKKVLLIDMDPQSHATISLGLIPAQQKYTTYSLLTGEAPIDAVAQKIRDHLYLIPSNLNLAGAESELAAEIGRETILKEKLAALSSFDFVLFDSPPSLGVLNINVLCAADEIFIPIQGEFLALNGISLLVKTLELIKKRLNPSLSVTGVIACMHNPQRLLSRETIEEVDRYFKGKLFQTKIRINVKLAEAPSQGKTIFEYDLESNGAVDYLMLAREILGLPLNASAIPKVEKVVEAPVRGAGGKFVSKKAAPAPPAARGPGGKFQPKNPKPAAPPPPPPAAAPTRGPGGRFLPKNKTAM
jgi:chromosome partitioning protein